MNFAGFDDWVEIFKGGTQVDMNGKAHDGDALIDKAVESFDPKVHEPPAVVGHPALDAPAFGWVEGLKTAIKGDAKVLLAKFKQVVPEFETAVKAGQYKKRSAAFYPDGRLRHVGFLGAAAPAVKALADMRFQDQGVPVVFEFSEFAASEEEKAAQEKRAKQYNIGIKEGGNVTKPKEWENVPDAEFLDPVNYRYPCPDAEQTRAAASYWGQEDNQAQYTPEERAAINARLDKFRKKFEIGEFKKGNFQDKGGFSMFGEKIKSLLATIGVDVSKVPDDALPKDVPPNLKPTAFTEADLDKAKKDGIAEGKKTAQAEFAEKQRQQAKDARDKEIREHVDQLINGGKIPPSWKDAGLVPFMQALDAEQAITFAEGKDQKSPYQWFKDFLQGFGKADLFAEIATKEKAGQAAEFAEAKEDTETGKSIAAKVNPPDAQK
jgi:hypothetical protein